MWADLVPSNITYFKMEGNKVSIDSRKTVLLKEHKAVFRFAYQNCYWESRIQRE